MLATGGGTGPSIPRQRAPKWAAVVGTMALLHCTSAPPVLPAPPARRVPADLIPGDLDVVVRVDLGAVRDSLGAAAVTELRRRSVGAQADEWGTSRLLTGVATRATTAWFAFRPGSNPPVLDHVLVLRGHFEGLDPSTDGGPARWSAAHDIGDGWRYHEAPARVARLTPARIYLRDSTVVVLVTTAELDAVERTLGSGAMADPRFAPLLPPTHGTLAVIARSRAVAGWCDDAVPAAAGLFGAAQRVSLVLNLADWGLEAEAALAFGAASDPDEPAVAAAATTVEHLERLRQSLLGLSGWPARLAERAVVTAEGGSVLCRVKVDRSLLREILGELGELAPGPTRLRSPGVSP